MTDVPGERGNMPCGCPLSLSPSLSSSVISCAALKWYRPPLIHIPVGRDRPYFHCLASCSHCLLHRKRWPWTAVRHAVGLKPFIFQLTCLWRYRAQREARALFALRGAEPEQAPSSCPLSAAEQNLDRLPPILIKKKSQHDTTRDKTKKITWRRETSDKRR